MTTIAYIDGVMACDSQITTGDDRALVGGNCEKIFRTGGGLMGISGDANDSYVTEAFLESIVDKRSAIKAFEKKLDDISEMVALLVFKDEPTTVYRVEIADGSQSIWGVEIDYGSSVGSGGKYAEVAMRCGLDAVQAVAVACEFDIYSGGDIQEYVL